MRAGGWEESTGAIGPSALAGSFADPIDVPEPTQLVDPDADVAIAALAQSREAICLTDALVDRPGPRILFVNRAYLELFCCDEEDAIGATPRIGQGPLTDRRVLDRIREHLVEARPVRAQAINYRLDRTAFRLRWSIDPILRGGRVVNYLAHLRDVTVEDRMRRRLAALDDLLSAGRAVAEVAGAERDRAVVDALVGSLTPMLAEIGRAEVRVGEATGATPTPWFGEVERPTTTTLAVGDVGSVDVRTHPDADALVDHLAMREVVTHAEWLRDLPSR